MTIAGSRLDIQMGLLWHQVDKTVPFEETRWKGGGEQDKALRKLARARLTGPLRREGLRDRVLDAAKAADQARKRRNAVVH